MAKLVCWIRTVYLTLRYGLKTLEIIYGHELAYTGEVWLDYWVMACERCGKEAVTGLGPLPQKREAIWLKKL